MHRASPLGEAGPVPTPIHPLPFLVRRKQSWRFINDPGPGLGAGANFLLHGPCSRPGRGAPTGTVEQPGEYDWALWGFLAAESPTCSPSTEHRGCRKLWQVEVFTPCSSQLTLTWGIKVSVRGPCSTFPESPRKGGRVDQIQGWETQWHALQSQGPTTARKFRSQTPSPAPCTEAHWPWPSLPGPRGGSHMAILGAQGQQRLCLCRPQPSRVSLLAAPTEAGPSSALSRPCAHTTHHQWLRSRLRVGRRWKHKQSLNSALFPPRDDDKLILPTTRLRHPQNRPARRHGEAGVWAKINTSGTWPRFRSMQRWPWGLGEGWAKGTALYRCSLLHQASFVLRVLGADSRTPLRSTHLTAWRPLIEKQSSNEETNPQKMGFQELKGKHPEVLGTPHHKAGWEEV